MELTVASGLETESVTGPWGEVGEVAGDACGLLAPFRQALEPDGAGGGDGAVLEACPGGGVSVGLVRKWLGVEGAEAVGGLDAADAGGPFEIAFASASVVVVDEEGEAERLVLEVD